MKTLRMDPKTFKNGISTRFAAERRPYQIFFDQFLIFRYSPARMHTGSPARVKLKRAKSATIPFYLPGRENSETSKFPFPILSAATRGASIVIIVYFRQSLPRSILQIELRRSVQVAFNKRKTN